MYFNNNCMKRLFFFVGTVFLLSCSDNKNVVIYPDIHYKYGKEELLEDFTVLRTALEEAHPGIYRYKSKSKINALFDSLFSSSCCVQILI